jgi:hypothetical protein
VAQIMKPQVSYSGIAQRVAPGVFEILPFSIHSQPVQSNLIRSGNRQSMRRVGIGLRQRPANELAQEKDRPAPSIPNGIFP